MDWEPFGPGLVGIEPTSPGQSCSARPGLAEGRCFPEGTRLDMHFGRPGLAVGRCFPEGTRLDMHFGRAGLAEGRCFPEGTVWTCTLGELGLQRGGVFQKEPVRRHTFRSQSLARWCRQVVSGIPKMLVSTGCAKFCIDLYSVFSIKAGRKNLHTRASMCQVCLGRCPGG